MCIKGSHKDAPSLQQEELVLSITSHTDVQDGSHTKGRLVITYRCLLKSNSLLHLQTPPLDLLVVAQLLYQEVVLLHTHPAIARTKTPTHQSLLRRQEERNRSAMVKLLAEEGVEGVGRVVVEDFLPHEVSTGCAFEDALG